MALPTTSLSSLNDDEEIIDLTDIVEKGAVPEGTGKAQGGEHSLESQMADLLSGGEEADAFDLDALLKESGLDAAAGEQDPAGGVDSIEFDAPDMDIFPEEAPSPEAVLPGEAPAKMVKPGSPAHGSPAAEPESEEMPDLGDVDALLRDLLPPEQPAAGDASGKAAHSAPEADAETEEVDEDDLDSLLASFDNVSAKPEKSATPASSDEDDDLDSLLDSIMNSDSEKPVKQAAARQAPAMVEGDALDDLLKAAMEEETAPAAEAEPAFASEGEPDAEYALGTMDDDLDDLLKAAKTEETPPLIEAKAASAPESGSSAELENDDFDDLMKSLLAGEDTPADKTASSSSGDDDANDANDFDELMKSLAEAEDSPAEDAPFPVAEVEDDELDDLLNSVMPDVEKLVAEDDTPPPAKTVKAELNALLNSVQADMEAQAKPINPQIAAASLDELDALIAGLDAEEEVKPEVSPEEREHAMSALLEALGSPDKSQNREGAKPAAGQENDKPAAQMNESMDFADALAAEMTAQELAGSALATDSAANASVDASVDGALAFDSFSSDDQGFAAGSSLDDLDQLLASVVASQPDMHEPVKMADAADVGELEDFPLESDLGDPLLVGDTPFVGDSDSDETDLGAAVLQSLESLATEIAGLQERMESFSAAGTAQDSVVLLQTQMEHMQAEVRDMAENHAEGLAAAEARVSVMEAEFAERAAGESELVPRLEQKVADLEASLEKMDEVAKRQDDLLAAAESKIAALEAELTTVRLPSGLMERMEALEAALAAQPALNEEDTDKPDLAGDIARLVDRVESLEIGVKNAGRLEERVGALESDVDKAAAEAAARVIREEIAALLSDMAATDEE